MTARLCAVCGATRGHTRKGWAFTIREGIATATTCPACPTDSEPVRRVVIGGRVRFRAVVDSTPRGARKRQQVTRTLDTLTAARDFVTTTRAQVEATGRVAPVETVAALTARWLNSRRDVRAVTVHGYRNVLAAPLRRLGHRPVGDVTVGDIEALIVWLGVSGGQHGGPLAPRSVRAARTALSQVFGLAVREGTLTVNPVALSHAPRQRVKVGTDLTHWQPSALLAFRDTADTDQWAALLRLSLSGLTRSEVCGLRWSDVDLDAGTVTITQGRVTVGGVDMVDDPKSAQRWRTVPVEQIHPGTSALLRTLRAAQAADKLKAGTTWHDTGLVAVDANGKPLHPDAFSARFKRLCGEAGVPVIRLHNVRHSLAHWGFNVLGVSAPSMAATLGHTTAVFLAVYAPEGGSAGIAEAARAFGAAQAVAL